MPFKTQKVADLLRHTLPAKLATALPRRPRALGCWPMVAGALAFALGLAACSGPLPKPVVEGALASAPQPAAPGWAPTAPAEPSNVAVARPMEQAPAQTDASQPTPAVLAAGVDVVLAKGRASWYGPRFHGRRTASGERFDMHALTAAHKTLPFGSRVRVHSVHTGQQVVVRINDRGPYKHQRIIDLSYAAAKALGVKERGVTEVILLRE
jgi:rare lipoprotein A